MTHITISIEEAQSLLPELRNIALAAGALELEHYNRGADVMVKNDGSPVTLADQEAEAIILAGLKKATPNIPIVAEEEVAAGRIPDISGGTYWLVDPLDGTKEFIKKSGDFTVNMALMIDDEPVLGVIYAPVMDELFMGCGNGTAVCSMQGNAEKSISVRVIPEEGLTVLASRSHSDSVELENFLEGKKVANRSFRGSSLKMCEIAAGRADIYPRLAPTCEWDIAAGHAILSAAGGKIVNLDGSKFIYGKTEERFLNPRFIASS